MANFERVLLGLLGILGAAAVALWGKIVSWTRYSLLPWVDENYPELRGIFEEALVSLDSVIAPLRAAAINAWKEIRKIILKATQVISERSDNVFVREFCAYVVKFIQGEPTVIKVTSEEIVDDLSSLPAEVRETFLRNHSKRKEIDVTAIKDEETGVYEVHY
jgi:hypothetical protein